MLQPIETYVTQDQRKTVIFYSLGNFLSNQSATYVQDLMPDKTAEPRESIIAKFAVVKRDYGPAGTRAELSDVGIMPDLGGKQPAGASKRPGQSSLHLSRFHGPRDSATAGASSTS